MYENLFSDASFPHALLALDGELAAETQSRGCPHCGAALHVANYPRKPRGGPWALGQEQSFRHGLCCSREGCRRRTAPPSVRFLGRRVYLAAMVVLGTALQHGLPPKRLARLQAMLGVDRRTLRRWRRWWTEQFPKTATFEALRAALVPPLTEAWLPRSLLERFTAATAAERVRALLRWLACPENAR